MPLFLQWMPMFEVLFFNLLNLDLCSHRKYSLFQTIMGLLGFTAVFFIIGNLCNLNFWFVEIKHTRPSFMGQFISADPSGAQNMPSVSATVSFPKENLTNTEGDISKRGPRPEHKPQLTFII